MNAPPLRLRRTRHHHRATVLLAILCLSCCPAWPPEFTGVQIADQEVLVIWDEKNGIEHFARRPTFAEYGDGFRNGQRNRDFGFLVPTPTQPELSETPDEVFSKLGEVIKPEVKIVRRYDLSLVPLLLAPFAMMSKDAADSAADAGEVYVLQTTYLAGYEVTVLRADEVDSLLGWLKSNGYDARPELQDWLQPYVDKQWIITAFKYAPKTDADTVSTAAVCMSFATDAPFFPYRVPTDQLVPPERGSLLRLYYASDQRSEGHFEANGDPWQARTHWSGPLKNAATLLDDAGNTPIPENLWLTAFEDRTWPGGTEDLYFSDSAEKPTVKPPPILHTLDDTIWLPSDLILGGIAAVFFVRRRSRTKKTLSDAL